MPPIEHRIRQANPDEESALLRFYTAHHSAALPAASYKLVADTIRDGRILVVERCDDRELVASAAVFQVSPSHCRCYVGELAGMRATPAVGGLRPIAMQIALLGLRLLGHAALNLAVEDADATDSLITIVKSTNSRSTENVVGIGMKPLITRPAWLEYDALSWHGSAIGDDWRYFFADTATVARAMELLEGAGLHSGRLELERNDRETAQLERFMFHLELPHLAAGIADLKNVLQAGAQLNLAPPPEQPR
jgi:hypothetical protein